ncbi:MAG: YaiI/YqxD family protein [Clostridia bacterium]|nr:YaiI/YqxD family protein [Clostridia bacterium]
MKIVIDADACPVLDITLCLAAEKGIDAVIVCDNAHFIERENIETIVVDKGADSADIKIANTVKKGDIVVTQDYGLAALCLGKGAKALNQNGLIFTDKNIENLLYSRFMAKKARMAGGRTKGPSKRTTANDTAFIKALTFLLEES